MIDPLLLALLGLLLGLFLLAAGGHKLASLASFRATLNDYQLVPAVLLAPFALVIPLFECGLGLAWLTRFEPTLAAALTAALFVLYSLAIGLNLWRGRVHIHCGCGFGSTGEQLSWWLVVRNLILALLALSSALPVAARTLGGIDGFSLAAAVPAVLLLYAGWLQLLKNRSAIVRWRTDRA